MDRGKICGLFSLAALIINILTLYLGNSIRTNAPLTYTESAALGVIAIIIMIVGTSKAFLGGAPDDNYFKTQVYFFSGIIVIGLILVVQAFSFSEVYATSINLFIIYCVNLIICIVLLLIAAILYRPKKKE